MIITSALLERGDLFRFGDTGTLYRVNRIGGGYVYYKANSGGTPDRKIGLNSKQRLTLVMDYHFGDPSKLKNHMEILVPEERYVMLAD